jgi:hypothetical protein
VHGAWRATLEETRAWVNFEVVEVLHQKEEREWTSLARLRQRLEKPSEPPADMLDYAKSGVRKLHRRMYAIRVAPSAENEIRGEGTQNFDSDATANPVSPLDSREPKFELCSGTRSYRSNFSTRS